MPRLRVFQRVHAKIDISNDGHRLQPIVWPAAAVIAHLRTTGGIREGRFLRDRMWNTVQC